MIFGSNHQKLDQCAYKKKREKGEAIGKIIDFFLKGLER